MEDLRQQLLDSNATIFNLRKVIDDKNFRIDGLVYTLEAIQPPATDKETAQALECAHNLCGHSPDDRCDEDAAVDLARAYRSKESQVAALEAKLAEAEKDKFKAVEEEAHRWNLEINKVFNRAEAAEQTLLSSQADLAAMTKKYEAEKRALERSQACDKNHLDHTKKMVAERDAALAQVEAMKKELENIMTLALAEAYRSQMPTFESRGKVLLDIRLRANAALSSSPSPSQPSPKTRPGGVLGCPCCEEGEFFRGEAPSPAPKEPAP